MCVLDYREESEVCQFRIQILNEKLKTTWGKKYPQFLNGIKSGVKIM